MTKFIRFFVVCLIVGLGSSSVSGGFNTGNSDIDLAGLNRDIDNVQEITKDEITGALDGSVTIDNRVLTESGRDQIADQHEKLGENLEQIGDGLRNNIVVKSIENAITDDTKDIIDTVGDYIEQDRQMTEMMKERRDLVEALNGLTNYDSAEARELLQQVADHVVGIDGFSGDLKLAAIDGNVVGFAYQSEDGSVRNISLNLANLDMTDPNAVMKAIYHETTNFEDHTNNDRTAKNRGDTGAGIFDLKNYGNENTNTMDNGQWLSNYGDSDTIQNGNMSLVSDMDNASNGTGDGAGFWLGGLLSSKPIPIVEAIKPVAETVKPAVEATKPVVETVGKTVGETVKAGAEQVGKAGIEKIGELPIQDIVKNLGEVSKGATDNIRTLPKSEFEPIRTKITETGKKIETPSSYKDGQWYEMPNGDKVGIRNSTESGETIDVIGSDLKIHFAP